MKPFAAAIVLLVWLFPSAVYSQEYTRFRLPAGMRCTVASETFQCYSLPEMVELLHMDADLRTLTDQYALVEEQVLSLSLATAEMRLALIAAEAQAEVLTTERARLTAQWTEENRLRLEAENRPEWDWIPWTLAGIFAVSTVVLVLVVALSGGR